LIVNRPFIFAIRERLSGTILFLGLIGDPSQEEMPDDDTEPLGCR
jgi:serine protease inhibitor